MMIKHIASLCLAAAAAFTTSDAAARWTRTTPWACHVIQGTALDTNWALQNDSTGSDLVALCPVLDTDYLRKQDLVLNNALPKISVDPETYEVRADGELLTSAPAEVLPMAQRYFLF